jgi:hypothetical protein
MFSQVKGQASQSEDNSQSDSHQADNSQLCLDNLDNSLNSLPVNPHNLLRLKSTACLMPVMKLPSFPIKPQSQFGLMSTIESIKA